MDSVRVFVSHSTQFAGLATTFADRLKGVAGVGAPMTVLISEHMQGGDNWRSWIRESAKNADIFLLLYPHASMDLQYCGFELGLFDANAEKRVLTVRNIDIETPRIASNWQSYLASEPDLYRFFKELLSEEVVQGKAIINPDVAKADTAAHREALAAARVLAAAFSEARSREDYFEDRICISTPADSRSDFDLTRASIEGNDTAMKLLGLKGRIAVPWPVARETIMEVGERGGWVEDLEKALPEITSGAIPPPLSPFQAQDEIFIPVITKTESVDRRLRKIYAIFVEANESKLKLLFGDWNLPRGTPPGIALLIALMRLVMRVRWEVLDDAVRDLRMAAQKANPGDEAKRVLDRVQTGLDEIEAVAARHLPSGMNVGPAYFSSKERLSRATIAAEQYGAIRARMRSTTSEYVRQTASLLEEMANNNAVFLQITTHEFAERIQALLDDSVQLGDLSSGAPGRKQGARGELPQSPSQLYRTGNAWRSPGKASRGHSKAGLHQ